MTAATAPAAVTQPPAEALAQERIDTFWRQGFLSYGPILDEPTLALLRQQYDLEMELAQRERTSRNLSAPADADAETQRRAPRQMIQIMNLYRRNAHFHRLLYDRRILDVVECLIGPNIMLFHDQALFKPAHTGGPVTWHQDNAYWHCRPANLVSCWLTLDDVDESNGAMQLIPGSHLAPLWHDRAGPDTVLLQTGGFDQSRKVVVELPAGGCMFHHCQTLHHTAPNDTDRQRRAWAIHFMPAGTTHHGGQAMPVGYEHPMLRARI